jgi:cytochrome b6-f complex iron-sulfur subunit
MTLMNRRDFLKNTTLTGLGAAAGLAVLNGIDLTNVQAAPMHPGGEVREIPLVLVDTPELQSIPGSYHLEIDDIEKSILVVRTGDASFLAIDLKCTHKGCELAYENKTGEKFVCPCHGSAFSTAGQVLNGPASKPTMVYKTAFKGGTVTVFVPTEGDSGGSALSPGGGLGGDTTQTLKDSTKK